MTLEGYATFFIGSILISLALAVIGILLVFLNYIFYKYWRPVNIGYWAPNIIKEAYDDKKPRRFMTEEEFIEYQKMMAVRDREDPPPKIEPKLDK